MHILILLEAFYSRDLWILSLDLAQILSINRLTGVVVACVLNLEAFLSVIPPKGLVGNCFIKKINLEVKKSDQQVEWFDLIAHDKSPF